MPIYPIEVMFIDINICSSNAKTRQRENVDMRSSRLRVKKHRVLKEIHSDTTDEESPEEPTTKKTRRDGDISNSLPCVPLDDPNLEESESETIRSVSGDEVSSENGSDSEDSPLTDGSCK